MVFGHSMAGSLKRNIQCDIIIAGAGLAGISLLYRAMKEKQWIDQKIVVVDKSTQAERPGKNWSFWKRSAGPFDELSHKKWDKLSFFSQAGVRKSLELGEYTYHTVKSKDFYSHCLAFLRACLNITFIDEEISSLTGDGNYCYLETESYSLTGTYAFNSVYQKPELSGDQQYFLQHFKGLLIQSRELKLDSEEAYLMDFRTSQEHGTSFFYTLPINNNEVFVEYTIFSKHTLPQSDYDEKLNLYIRDVLKLNIYDVVEEEYGVIPMTDFIFPRFQGNIINIGSAGGDTRGATGYTFTNVQKSVDSILASWSINKTPFFKRENIGLKHKIYDACLLRVLDAGEYKGHKVFEDLFMHSRASIIFSFLDAESSLLEDLAVIFGLKPMAFAKAMYFVIKNRIIG